MLFVDDDAKLRAVVRYLLEESGYRVETADDGREAWKRICAAMQGPKKGYDLVITDLDMPDVDGIELIRMVRKVGFAVRIMVYTGELTRERQLELNNLEVDAAVEKGIEAETLLNLVHKIVDGDRGMRAGHFA